MYRRPETKAAEEKVYKQKQIGEFMTTWKDFPRPGLAGWAERKKAGLMGTAKSTHYTPRFRPFDMLSIPNQSLVILENEYHRIGVESVVGVQDSFHRYIDSDMVYFQFCGNSTVETEFGVYELEPGEVMLVPGGIAHRSIGRNDSLRYFCQSHEAVDYVMKEDQYTSLTSFEVKRIGGPNWTAPQGANALTKGSIVEQMHFWDDGPDDQTVVERDYESLVGVAGLRRGEPGSLVRKLRAFVPPQAQGFSIRTSTLQLIDRGTEFGLRLDRSGDADISPGPAPGAIPLRHERQVAASQPVDPFVPVDQ